MMNHEILAPGMVYYKNAIPDPQKTIETIEYVQNQLKNGVKSIAQTWHEWNGANPDIEKFCQRHFIINPYQVNPSLEKTELKRINANIVNLNDPLYKELCFIHDNIAGGIEKAFSHYASVLYPLAARNIKSTEGLLSILKYSKSGYLPPHQDQGVSSRVLSTVGYLNDDYVGGEIYFEHVDVSIKPEAGSVIFFPSNFVYVHEVKEMKSGIRYAVPQWYHSLPIPRMSTGEE
jgi:hypothetical protein